MNDLITPPRPDIPAEIQTRWQRILDMLAMIMCAPACVIMKADLSQIDVFLSSATGGNPFHRGMHFGVDTRLYCEKAMKERVPLLVPHALKDPEWEHSLSLQMVGEKTGEGWETATKQPNPDISSETW